MVEFLKKNWAILLLVTMILLHLVDYLLQKRKLPEKTEVEKDDNKPVEQSLGEGGEGGSPVDPDPELEKYEIQLGDDTLPKKNEEPLSSVYDIAQKGKTTSEQKEPVLQESPKTETPVAPAEQTKSSSLK